MTKYFTLLFMLLIAAASHSQTADSYPGDILHDYFGLQLEMVRVTPGFTPPVVSRALGYTGLCAYEAAVHGTPSMNSFVGILPQMNALPSPEAGQDYHWGIVTNNALYGITLSLYGSAPNSLLNELGNIKNEYAATFVSGTPSDVILASEQFGDDLAAGILAYTIEDNEEECYLNNYPTGYIAPTGPNNWTPIDDQLALQPYWGEKRCFVMEFVDESLIANPPPTYSIIAGSDFYNEAFAVYDAVNNVTPEQTDIAEYWEDGDGTYSPPGHSIQMLRFIMMDENEDLAFSAQAYARLGMAMADAFVACWKTKYEFNLLRPLQYIQENIDPDWGTVVETPPFPEYVSGHSTQSGAFGEVMNAIYSDNFAFIDSTYGDQFGGPRFFNNFVESAEETAISRLYGGVHYPVGNNEGITLGVEVGELINELFNEVANGIIENDAIAVLGAYPNPTQGELTLDIPNSFFTTEVMDATGSLIAISVNQKRLDLSDLQAGLYVLRVKDEKNTTIGISRVLVE